MQTIAKNRAAYIDGLFANGSRFVCHCLETGFQAEPVSPEWVRQELSRGLRTKLTHQGNGHYHVTVHGNLWYEFESTAS